MASGLQKGTLTRPLATRLIGRDVLITFVTFGELAKWAEIRNWGERRRGELAALPCCPAMRPWPQPGGYCPPQRHAAVAPAR